MRRLFLVLVAAFSLLTPLAAQAVLPGSNPGSGGPGTGPGPINPALTAGTSLDVSHDLGDHGIQWFREIGVEAGQILWFRWQTAGAGGVEGRYEIRDQADALVIEGISSGLQTLDGYRQFSLSIDDLAGAPFTIRIRPFSSVGAPVAQWSNPVLLSAWEPGDPTCFTPAGVGEPIYDKLYAIRDRNYVPALAGAIVNRSGMSIFDAVGVRSTDSQVPVTPQDKWHLGSITKSMTATLAAILIQGFPYLVSPETSIRDVFANEPWFADLNAHFKDLMLKELLAQHSGLVANPQIAIDQLEDTDLSLIERRLGFTRYVGQEQISLGKQFFYHNGNFVIAAAMLEKIFAQSWEVMIQGLLFEPLGMYDTGFGTAVLDGVSQPVGHGGDSGFVVAPGDNTDGLGPAGLVHTTLVDLGKYVRLFLNGSEGDLTLLPSTLDMIFAPYPTDEPYNWGWVNSMEPGGLQLWHNGSNNNWYAEVTIRPDEGFGLIAATNIARLGTDPDPGRGLVAVGEAMAMLMQHQTGCPAVPGRGAFGSFDGGGTGLGGSIASPGLRQPISGRAQTLQVDVLPKQCRRPLKAKARGKVKVAILSTENFDATTLDADSLRLAGDAQPLKVRTKDVGGAGLAGACSEESPKAARAARKKDGRKDLLLTFRRADLLEILEAGAVEGAVSLTLQGDTRDGARLVGGEVVPVAPKR